MNFGPRNGPPPAFSLDRRDHARRRGMHKREWRLLVLMPLLLLFVGLGIDSMLDFRHDLPVGSQAPQITEVVLAPVATPRLGDAPPLPDAAAVAQIDPTVAELMADRARIRLDDEIDAATLSWSARLIAADQAAPPLPILADATDLMVGQLPAGASVSTEGRLEDAILAGPWLRLLLALENQQYAQLLTPADTAGLVVGHRVRIVGRHLGLAPVPTGTDSSTPLPLLVVARIAALPPERLDEDLAEFRTGFPTSLPPDLFDGISDERNALERRPYYTLLGQAKADRTQPGVLATAERGNVVAHLIHEDPPAHRGRLYHVTGRVYRAWEDPLPARDKPYGIDRVVRVLLWNRDLGLVKELEDGKPVIRTSILRLYELALATNQPLPAAGEELVATTRFFKFRAIPVVTDATRDIANDVERQSDKVYTFTFVGGDYIIVPPPSPYEITLSGVLLLLVALSMGGFLFYVVRRDARLSGTVFEQIRRIRATRKSIRS